MPESNAGTNLDVLLHAALLCDMQPQDQSVHRYQLFFVVQGHLARRVGTNDLQRALETATQNGVFAKPADTQDGRYLLTSAGHHRALRIHGTVKPLLAPAAPGACRFSVRSPSLGGHKMLIAVTDGKFEIRLDGEHLSGKAALDWLNGHLDASIPSSKDSQARRVYDYGVARGWPFVWRGEANNYAVPTADAAALASEVAALRDRRELGDTMPVPQGNAVPERTTVTTYAWRRLATVVEHVLHRARGCCELCGASPFIGSGGEIFLEVHHVRTLADGGPDTVDNAVALCPNCHRALHYAADRKSRVEAVYARVAAIKRY